MASRSIIVHSSSHHGRSRNTRTTQTGRKKNPLQPKILSLKFAKLGSPGHGKLFPRDTWVSSVIARNNKRLDIPVAKIVGNDYEPLPNVVWVFPPTKNNPKETVRMGR
jgi:hypothetical protein